MKDLHKTNAAMNNGYEILTVWESDYKKDSEGVTKQCLEFLTT